MATATAPVLHDPGTSTSSIMPKILIADLWSAPKERINDPIRADYLVNAYRVLLTRARQGMVIYVPFGSSMDDTRKPSLYDKTYDFLYNCGVTELT